MLTATGNINQPYVVIGVVTVTVVKPEKTGCQSGGLPVNAAYREAVEMLASEAQQAGGDGIIHIGFNYRISTTSGCSGNSNANFELYAWGTAISLSN